MILLIDNGTSFLEDFRWVFRRLDESMTVVPQDGVISTLADFDLDGIVLSGGGKPELTEPQRLATWEANTACLIGFDVPILGICEGFEILCACTGGRIEKLPEPTINPALPIRRETTNSILLQGVGPEFQAYEHHSDYAAWVPDTLRVEAASEASPVEVVSHRLRPLFGTQFHPEKSGELGERVFRNFVNFCRSPRASRA